MENLEKRNKEITGSNFIKSFEIIKLVTNQNEKSIIELILAFGGSKQLTHQYIADRTFISLQMVKKTLKKLEDKNYITRNKVSNYNGVAGGSKTTISVNINKIIEDVDKVIANKSISIIEDIQTLPTQTIEINDVKNDNIVVEPPVSKFNISTSDLIKYLKELNVDIISFYSIESKILLNEITTYEEINNFVGNEVETPGIVIKEVIEDEVFNEIKTEEIIDIDEEEFEYIQYNVEDFEFGTEITLTPDNLLNQIRLFLQYYCVTDKKIPMNIYGVDCESPDDKVIMWYNIAKNNVNNEIRTIKIKELNEK